MTSRTFLRGLLAAITLFALPASVIASAVSSARVTACMAARGASFTGATVIVTVPGREFA